MIYCTSSSWQRKEFIIFLMIYRAKKKGYSMVRMGEASRSGLEINKKA